MKAVNYPFSTGGSTSNWGHAVQYKIDWDDGSDTGWLASGTTSASHGWTVNGTYSSISDNAILTVDPGPLHHILISPDTSTITAGNTQAYTAEAFDQFNNSRGDVTSSTTLNTGFMALGSTTCSAPMMSKSWPMAGRTWPRPRLCCLPRRK